MHVKIRLVTTGLFVLKSTVADPVKSCEIQMWHNEDIAQEAILVTLYEQLNINVGRLAEICAAHGLNIKCNTQLHNIMQ